MNEMPVSKAVPGVPPGPREAPYTTERYQPPDPLYMPPKPNGSNRPSVLDDQISSPTELPGPGRGETREKPRFRTLQEFCAEYTPIAHVVDGLLFAGSLYTLTARTGVGKTAWLISTAIAIVTGRAEIINRNVIAGRVAFLHGGEP